MIEIEREARIAAPRSRIWAILADHEGMPAWFPAREVIRRRPGTPEPDGAGAVRVVRTSGLAVEEHVTAFEPQKRLEYAMTAGGPFRSYRGEVALEAAGETTRVRWRVHFRPWLPGSGRLLGRAVARQIERGLDGLARAAEGA